MSNNVELLAPAGNFESLIAAIQNGANAVYIGGNQFGARAFAGNFNREQLQDAVHYAHQRDEKIYVTVNTLIEDIDFDDCIDYIQYLYQIDVDAIILQDIGVAAAVNKLFPDFEIHASTQMSIANTLDASFYKSMGFSRLVLARENSVQEIQQIKNDANIEIESFVHGALCVSYSGKCTFSYFNGGRSSNKGTCAQPCRKKYRLKNEEKTHDLSYFLSTRDLCTIKNLSEILENGTDSIKIEGRMKRPEYVATVVAAYRKAIDAIESDIEIDLDQLELEMASVFNRTFTNGLILNTDAQSLVYPNFSGNIGIEVGAVTKVDTYRKRISILLKERLSKGDGISLGEFVGRILIDGKEVASADKGQLIELDFVGTAKKGDIIRKTSDKKILHQSIMGIREERIKIPLFAKITIQMNQHPSIEISDNRGNSIYYIETSEFVGKAQKKAIRVEDVEKQMKKTIDTAYYFEDLDIDMDDNCFLKISTINSLRRNALELIAEQRSICHHRANMTKKLVEPNVPSHNFAPSVIAPKMLRVKCRNLEQVSVCNEISVESIYVDSISLYNDCKRITNNTTKVFFESPVMLKDSHINELKKFVQNERPNILTTSIGFGDYLFNWSHQSGAVGEIRLNYLANISNRHSIHYINSLGCFESVAISVENGLLKGDLNSFWGDTNLLELPLYYYPMLMVTEFCPYKKRKPCNVCKMSNSLLLDETNVAVANIHKDPYCRLQLFSATPIDNTNHVQKFIGRGINKYRIEFMNEDAKKTTKVLNNLLGRNHG